MQDDPVISTEPSAWTPESLDAPHEASDKAKRIRRMFNGIAPRYERINSMFSAGRDAKWRRRAVQLADVHDQDTVLDIACGTGNLARAFAAACPRRVIGIDFAHEMLIRAANPHVPGTVRELRPSTPVRQGATALGWCEADALRLPFPAQCFSIVSCAFGIRNFADLDVGLGEMYRVLKPGGRAIVLEFSRPPNRLARRCYEFYANRVMPLAASFISGDKTGAYHYLPRSVVSFLDPDTLDQRFHRAGFASTLRIPLTLGVVTVYAAHRERG